MEDTLREAMLQMMLVSFTSLNPCSNGKYSQSYSSIWILRNKKS